MSQTYKIVRHYHNGKKRIIKRGLTLERAQEHCSDPDSSSSTANSKAARRVTGRHGEWFDGYTVDKN